MIALTDTATTKVKELIEAEDQPELFLRVAVRPGGCSGCRYEMFFDSEQAADDIETEYGEIKVVVDPASAAVPRRARRSTTRTASRAPGSRSTTRTRSAPAAAASPSRNDPRLRTATRARRAPCASRPAERAVERAGDRAAGVDAEQPRLARQVPRGDGRRRVVRAEVLVDLDVHDVDAVLVVADERQQAVEHRPAVLRLAPRRGREQHRDRLALADHRVERHGVQRAHADRGCRSGRRRAGSAVSATRRWARPHRWSARRRAPSPGTRTAASRLRDPRRRPRCLPCRRRGPRRTRRAVRGRPSSCSVVSTNVRWASSRRARPRPTPTAWDANPSFASIANAKRCGVLDT